MATDTVLNHPDTAAAQITYRAVTCGNATGRFFVGKDGLAKARVSGTLDASSVQLFGLLLRCAFNMGAAGMVCSMDRVAVDLPLEGLREAAFAPGVMSMLPTMILVSEDQHPTFLEALKHGRSDPGFTFCWRRVGFADNEEPALRWVREEIEIAADEAREAGMPSNVQRLH